MAAWIVLPLILLFKLNSGMGYAPSEWNLQPDELVRLKNSGATEPMIQSKVEEQRFFLNQKWAQAQHFQFVAKVIPSIEIGHSTWSIVNGSETLLKFRDDDGYMSTKTRAEVVARQLNRALLIGDGQFSLIQRNGQSTVAFESSIEPLMIVSASAEDSKFLQTDVSTIAKHWAVTLNQFWKSLPPILLHPLPAALTLPDLVLLGRTGFADRILLAFFELRDINRAVKAEQIKNIGFSKEVTEYLARRVTLDSPERMYRWDYWGSNGYCGNTSTSVRTTILFGGSGAFHTGTQQQRSSPHSTRGSSVNGSHAGLPGKSSNQNH